MPTLRVVPQLTQALHKFNSKMNFSGFSSSEEEEDPCPAFTPPVPSLPPVSDVLSPTPVPEHPPLPLIPVDPPIPPVPVDPPLLPVPVDPHVPHVSPLPPVPPTPPVRRTLSSTKVYLSAREELPPHLLHIRSPACGEKRGGNRGGGRTPCTLPAGCSCVHQEDGALRYICSCQDTFAEKRGLLHHHQICVNLDRSSIPANNKRRKLDDEFDSLDNISHHIDNDDQTESCITVVFNEDPEGFHLLQCK